MKTFKSIESAMDWAFKVEGKTAKEFRKEIAEDIYDDSEEFTYIDTQTMYDSGANSDFARGIITIKAPQARWLYYTHGIKPHRNKSARPMWFEATKLKNINKYIKKYRLVLNDTKKGS